VANAVTAPIVKVMATISGISFFIVRFSFGLRRTMSSWRS
jgi:hypothetical protein